MTPAQIIEELKQGNERFRAGKMAPRDYLAEKRASATGQYLAAVILGCVDSRVPAEIIFDAGVGDTFNGRVTRGSGYRISRSASPVAARHRLVRISIRFACATKWGIVQR